MVEISRIQNSVRRTHVSTPKITQLHGKITPHPRGVRHRIRTRGHTQIVDGMNETIFLHFTLYKP